MVSESGKLKSALGGDFGFCASSNGDAEHHYLESPGRPKLTTFSDRSSMVERDTHNVLVAGSTPAGRIQA